MKVSSDDLNQPRLLALRSASADGSQNARAERTTSTPSSLSPVLPSSATMSSSDSVAFSQTAALAAATIASQETNPRISQIQVALANGAYHVDTVKVASAVFTSMSQGYGIGHLTTHES